jgi:chemotaxis protein methyltransferase WspC
MNNMGFDSIKMLLQERIGLHADSIGVSSIERAVGHRMNHIGVTAANDYYSIIVSDSVEFSELVEEVVVPETWFFRNRSPFDALRKYVSKIRSKKNTKNANEPIRILSLPCATGEEPYSIAMALMEDGLKESDFHVDGVDISRRALAKAKHAVYGEHSFREPDINIQEKYFKKDKSGFILLPNVRNHVSFSQANIVSDDLFFQQKCYDVIFCRNLLIYFSRETQKAVLEKLYSILNDDGILFVGHAETAQVDQKHLSKIDFKNAFAYHKNLLVSGGNSKDKVDYRRDHGESIGKLKDIYDQLVEVTRKDIILSQKIKNTTTNNPIVSDSTVSNSYTVASVENNIDPDWANIERLIESGNYQEAILICEEYLQHSPEDADGYYYLGLVSNLRGSAGGAESLLKKAIYLSPNHQKALSLSVLLAENRGDDESANYYRRREKKSRERDL